MGFYYWLCFRVASARPAFFVTPVSVFLSCVYLVPLLFSLFFNVVYYHFYLFYDRVLFFVSLFSFVVFIFLTFICHFLSVWFIYSFPLLCFFLCGVLSSLSILRSCFILCISIFFCFFMFSCVYLYYFPSVWVRIVLFLVLRDRILLCFRCSVILVLWSHCFFFFFPYVTARPFLSLLHLRHPCFFPN